MGRSSRPLGVAWFCREAFSYSDRRGVTGWRDHQPVTVTTTMRVSGTCLGSLPCAELSGSGAQGFSAQQSALADEGEVIVATGGVRDGGAAVSSDTQAGQVPDVATIDTN